jgi:hypothetical protein
MFRTQFGDNLPLDVFVKIYDVLNRLIKEAESYDKEHKLEEDKSVGEFLYERFLELINNGTFDEIKEHVSVSNDSKFSKKENFIKLLNGFFLWRYTFYFVSTYYDN